MDVLANTRMSGLIGMGFVALTTTGQPTFMENLIAQSGLGSTLEMDVFSIHLARGLAEGSEVRRCKKPYRCVYPDE